MHAARSKECQRQDWKGGHKKICKTFREGSKAIAMEVLEQLSDESLSPGERVADLDRFDRAGYACRSRTAGIHAGIA